AKIAREACARCHNVDPGGPFKQHPPSFASIAVFRSQEQIYGRIVFPPLHSSMPQIGYMLTPQNVNHIIAYIVSLEAR
ncbi:MAG: c-type cytochrome, partial [Gammaproteobacteria bacterium]